VPFPPSGPVPIVLRPEEFRLLSDLVSARLGLRFGPDTRGALERRLQGRLTVLGHGTFAEYYQHLRFHAAAQAEWEEVQEVLTTNETYFFREEYQLVAFKNEVLPLLAEQGKGRRLSVWSAGCSTGEELYTLATLVHESSLFKGWDVHLFGFDLSKRCIAIARAGVYGQSSFRATPPEIQDTYFVKKHDGWHVADHIKAMCHFAQMNILDHDKARLLGRADAVFCRNVLIYFDQHARRRVIDLLHERLFPGGILLLGHSESLLHVTTAFELLHLRGDLVYRKPRAALPSGG
jgi:chemotaxis protein methyltransferase CheR